MSAPVATRTEPWKDLPPTAAQDGSFSVLLPPESLTTLGGVQKRGP